MSGCHTFRGARLFLFLLRRSDKVAMRTSIAVHCLCDGANRRMKSSWDGYFFAGERVKHRQYSTGLAFVFSRQVQFQPPMNSAKQDLRLQGSCLLYTSDAADEEDSVDLGGR